MPRARPAFPRAFPWAHSGGAAALYSASRTRDPRADREGDARAVDETTRVQFTHFRTETLRPLVGKTLEEVARPAARIRWRRPWT
jgi:hypothetical protein